MSSRTDDIFVLICIRGHKTVHLYVMTPSLTISTRDSRSSFVSDHTATSASENKTSSPTPTNRSALESIGTVLSRLDPRAHFLSKMIQKAIAAAGTKLSSGVHRLWWGGEGWQGIAIWGGAMPPMNADGAAEISLADLKFLEAIHFSNGWAEQSMKLRGQSDRNYLISVVKDSDDGKRYFPNSIKLNVVEQ